MAERGSGDRREEGFTAASLLNPFAVWQKLYETSEKLFSGALEKAMNTGGFALLNGKLMETILASQKALRDSVRSLQQGMNVPTREDLARLGELILQLEEKVDQIQDRLAQLEPAPKKPDADGAKER